MVLRVRLLVIALSVCLIGLDAAAQAPIAGQQPSTLLSYQAALQRALAVSGK